MEHENEESFKLYYIIEYIKQNFIGLIMLVFVFLIIYTVDNINKYNALLSQLPKPNSTPISFLKIIPKGKKNKKN
jgi:hypothetical protein